MTRCGGPSMSDLTSYSDDALTDQFWNRLGLFLAVAREVNHRGRASLGFADIRQFPALDQPRWQQLVNHPGFKAGDLPSILDAVTPLVHPPVAHYQVG